MESRPPLTAPANIGGLRSLDPSAPDIAQNLRTAILPHIHDADGIARFLNDEQLALDPKGIVAEWTRSFPAAPSAPTLVKPGPNASQPEYARVILATIAHHYGLHTRRNLFRNIALLQSSFSLASEIARYASESSVADGPCETLAQFVRSALDQAVPDEVVDVNWRWRHAEKIAESVAKRPRESWLSELHLHGFLTVICTSRMACYRVLGALHEAFDYRTGEIVDGLRPRRASGHPALYTHLFPSLTQLGPLQSIPVQLIPSHHEAPADDITLIQAIANPSPDDQGVHAYTPEGRQVVLPHGSTPIDFAYEIRHDWVARLGGVTINGKGANLLEPISDGDVVDLDLTEEPVPLPSDWRSRISRKPKDIIDDFRQGYRDRLQALGQRWLLNRLQDFGISAASNESLLKEALQGAVDAYREAQSSAGLLHGRSASASREVGWWFEQFELYRLSIEMEELRTEREYVRKAQDLSRPLQSLTRIEAEAWNRSPVPFPPPAIDERVVATILDETASRLQTEKIQFRYSFDLDPKVRERISVYDTCRICQPALDGQLDAEEQGDNKLVFHRPEAPCAGPNVLRVVSSRRTPQNQHFVVEVTSTESSGTAVPVLKVFSDCEIEVEDIAGHQIGRDWGVVRVRTAFLDRAKVDHVLCLLKKVPCVNRVFGPEHIRVPALEAFLPPRRPHASPLQTRAAPYVVGPFVESDSEFYGMDLELQELHDQYRRIQIKDHPQSRTVFVHGPWRIGKSSLIAAFLRDVRDARSLTLRIQALSIDRWGQTRDRIGRELTAAAIRRGLHVQPYANGTPLIDTISEVRHKVRGPLVLVLDEAGGMFQRTERGAESDNGRDLDDLLTFVDAFEQSTGCLLVWVGPEISHLRLGPTAPILRRARQVKPSPFTLPQTQDLLRASHKAPLYNIELSPGIADRVHELTSGHPLWTAGIADLMWAHASSYSGAVYDDVALDYAHSQCVRKHQLFEDTIPADPTQKRALRALASYGAPMSASRVVRELAKYDKAEVVHSALEHLVETGAATASGHLQQTRYLITSPLFADYILHSKRCEII